ncbi:hypothetical protein TRM7557_03105 [Tritonibacter multivorans]|uniref:Glycosyl transferase family 28 C-terminal domain-containing protein n=1 Tax=Tritonibacter multivorans TaxID=928856 RepID=A0A0P1GXY9_9RHOB|nr:glycosyltransferase [Tritonibacter multivorans]MDA7422765.1 glycosyltransferase [Tritonibacter multivorans]CUH80852.1 hypothetical protein TRM7557_03105 [Tritonibacter multivorans]SFD56586.1 UDP-N-acetylglucosamine transferase subunit ALG13 [Tritonibacter multivorans]
MIFLTVGTQLPFDRLVQSVDAWAEANPSVPVFAQVGAVGRQGYTPRHMDFAASLPAQDYDQRCKTARLVIAHAGTGSFIKALSMGTPLLAMPRRAEFGEHRNDHQVATANHFAGRDGISIVSDPTELAPAITRLLATDAVAPILSPYASDALLASIRTVIFDEQ